MRKWIAWLTALLLLVSVGSAAILPVAAAEDQMPSRVINLVYDDSDSMVTDNAGNHLDTWCQAKYAMEVFAAMLGEKDSLNIYYMSDYVRGDAAAPRLALKGSNNASVTEANVKRIHDTVTRALGTPFNSVKKAYKDLKSATADEKWLVVLTDGKFDNTSDATVSAEFDKYVQGGAIQIMMLTMGSNVPKIAAKEDKGIYIKEATNSKKILTGLTGICNQIFQRNQLVVSEENTVTFGVPMSQLIVFAQGKNVSIGNIKGDNGSAKASSNVKVAYSEKASTHEKYAGKTFKKDESLLGYVATFNGAMQPGAYTIDVKGADSISVFYKPNVTIQAYMYDADGKEVTQEEYLGSGTYRLEYGFADASTGERVADTSLLGAVEYTSTIVNTPSEGDSVTIEAQSGDQITIREGKLDIDVSARFLEYNTVQSKLHYDVYIKSDLVFEFVEKPTYQLSVDGMKNGEEPMILTAKLVDGNGTTSLTSAQWEAMKPPTITSGDSVGDFKVEKSEEIGKFLVYPTMKDNDPMETQVGKIGMKVKGGFVLGMSSAEGSLKDSFEIESDITSWQRIQDFLKKHGVKLLIALILLIILIGYIPGVKKYLPKTLAKHPVVECRSTAIGGRKQPPQEGILRKGVLSTIIPYAKQTGTIDLMDIGVLRVRAKDGAAMTLLNIDAFADDRQYTFDGDYITAETQDRFVLTPGKQVMFNDSRRKLKHSCILNQKSGF